MEENKDNKNKNVKTDEDVFGLPKVSYTPMGNVEMQTQFYKALAKRRFQNPFIRLLGLFFTLVFVIPIGIFFIYMAVLYIIHPEYSDTPWLITGIQLIFGLFWVWLGVKMVINLAKNK